MSILTKSKKEVIKEFAQAGAKGKADTGSVEVQAAVITKQINKHINNLIIFFNLIILILNYIFNVFFCLLII